MSFAALSSHAAAEEHALSLPPGALAGLLTDFLNLLTKWVPRLLAGEPAASFHADMAALADAHDQAHKLPPGTILGVLKKWLPIVLQILGGIGGVAAP